MSVDKSLVSRVESGQNRPTADFVVALSAALKLDVREALLRAGFSVHESSFKEPGYSTSALEIDRLLNQIPDAIERSKTLNIVRSVLKTAIQNAKAVQEKAEMEADRRELMALFDQLTDEDQETLLWAARSSKTKGKGAKDNETKGAPGVVRAKPAKAG